MMMQIKESSKTSRKGYSSADYYHYEVDHQHNHHEDADFSLPVLPDHPSLYCLCLVVHVQRKGCHRFCLTH